MYDQYIKTIEFYFYPVAGGRLREDCDTYPRSCYRNAAPYRDICSYPYYSSTGSAA
jgi:hypothetical protein